MNKEQALQRITDYETVAMHGSKEETQEALECVTTALYQTMQSLEPGTALDQAINTIESTMPGLFFR